MLAKEPASTNVKDSRFVRYAAFCTVWFVAVPLAGAFLVVMLLSIPDADPASHGVFSALRAFGREQPVPVCIIAFTLLEMVLWGQRHALPGAGLAGVAGRTDLPGGMRRKFEDAGGLPDEADRIPERRPPATEPALATKRRDE